MGEPTWGYGACLLFGQVSRGELDKIAKHIMEVLTDADDVIAIYKDSLCRMGGIPRFLQWRFGGEVRVDPHRDRLTPAYRLLSLICLTKGGQYDDIEILVQEDEWPFENKWTPYDQEFIHEPWDGVRIGADVSLCRMLWRHSPTRYMLGCQMKWRTSSAKWKSLHHPTSQGNLRQCDAVIVILCQRYGPSLESAGFPDLSATHLEYSEAKKLR